MSSTSYAIDLNRKNKSIDHVNIFNLIKCKYYKIPKEHDTGNNYYVLSAYPATGLLYITANSPDFISGHVRLRGKDQGQYPYKYLEMIDYIFGKEDNTIEACSYNVRGA